MEGIASGAIRDRSGNRYKPGTIRGYAPALRKRAVPAFGPTQLARLTRPEVQLWIDSLEGAPNTVRNAVTALQALYAWAIPPVLAQVNPTRDLRLPSGETPRDRIATPQETRALIAVLPPTDQAVMGLVFYAGLRRGEALAMDAAQIESERLYVVRSWDPSARVFGEPKHGSVRSVPICDELVALLADHRILMNHASGVLFPSSRSLGSRSTPAHSLAVCRTPGMRRA